MILIKIIIKIENCTFSMPFLGKDWRSSGENWIKTEHGWERTKVIECFLYNLNNGFALNNFSVF
jgi:hypothetical protein